MKLSKALRLSRSTALALVGAGGKTTALLLLASEMAPALVTTTTHIGAWQTDTANQHMIVEPGTVPSDLGFLPQSGITLVTGPKEGKRFTGVSKGTLQWLRAIQRESNIPLLIEADGAREKPLKAPADHEPVIPDFVDVVVVVAGLSALGKPVCSDWIHRVEHFETISNTGSSRQITPGMVAKSLLHPQGGLKGIPANTRRIALLNQADTIDLQSAAGAIARQLLPSYHSVVIAALKETKVIAVHEPVAGIILAAGGALRFGKPKQTLAWRGKPFIQHVAETADAAGLSPVVLVSGAYAEVVEPCVDHLPITITRNPDWQLGQSTSIQAGIRALPSEAGAAIFLLADQPQVTTDVLRALVERHSLDLSPIVATQVQGQRANPVIFDRNTFPDLSSLEGDTGGRQLFSRYPGVYLPWHDERLLLDIDTQEDYNKLIEAQE